MKDRYLELHLDLVGVDRRKTNTVINPEMERRRNWRRRQAEIKRLAKQEEENKKKQERKNLLQAFGLFLIGSSIVIWLAIEFSKIF